MVVVVRGARVGQVLLLLRLAPHPPHRPGGLLPGGGEGGVLLGPVAGAQVDRAGNVAAQSSRRSATGKSRGSAWNRSN